jgi:hypothetical protein
MRRTQHAPDVENLAPAPSQGVVRTPEGILVALAEEIG